MTWDFYHTGDGYRLTAIYTKATPYDEAAADKLLPWLTYEFQTYTALAERSGIPLAQVVSGAKTLDRLGLAMPTCNRNGNLYAIRKRHSFKVQR